MAGANSRHIRKEGHMIRLFRIDDRLLHGQVAFAWTKTLSIDTIYVVNDEVVKDDMTKMTLGIAKPRGTRLTVYGVEDGINKIRENLNTRAKVMIIINNVNDAYTILNAIPELKTINFGGIKQKPGIESKRFTGAICLTMEDIETCKKINELGVEMEIRQVPEEKKTILNNLI